MGQRGKLQGILEKIKLNSNEDKHKNWGDVNSVLRGNFIDLKLKCNL